MSATIASSSGTAATLRVGAPDFQDAQTALRSKLRQARQGGRQSSARSRAFAPTDAASVPVVVRTPPQTAAQPGEDLLLWMGDRGRARRLGKGIRVLLLQLAEREPVVWARLWHSLTVKRGRGVMTPMDDGLKAQLIPLIGRMRVDYRHVHDRRASSLEERDFVVRALRQHAGEALRQMDREEIDRVGVALRSGHSVLDTGFAALEERLAESLRKATHGVPGGEAAMTRCTQSVLALNCLKEALMQAVVEATPEQAVRRR
ncbi:hypothetical protein CDL60_23905 [Roseateles noduli]|nr:hypothetical protein CDL60_23905 [Roseateles noduli]